MSNENHFFEQHFAAIVTAIVTLIAALAATYVSYTQIEVAKLNKDKEIALSRSIDEAKRELDSLKAMRSWKMDLANFMAKHRKEIFSNDKNADQIKKIMLVTFPPNITSNVFGSLIKIDADEGGKEFWESAFKAAGKLQGPKAKLFIESDFPDDIIDLIADTIAEGDTSYDYGDQTIPKGLTGGDVRYFRVEDKEIALDAKEGFEAIACGSGYRLFLKLIPMLDSADRAPAGTIEVWLSSSAIHGKVNPDDC